jgi:hypothetical protein
MATRQYTNLDNYYENEDNWGNHQYVTIKDVVNNFIFAQDDDSYAFNSLRSRVAYFAKRGVQELYYDIVNEVISIELELNPTLIIALPHDFVQYVRISWVDQNGKLHPLAIDNSSNLSQAYLQDHEYDYLYDSGGDILQGSHIQDLDPTGSTIDYSVDGAESYVSPYYTRNGPFNTNRSKIFKNGSYRIDKDRGIIQFSSTVMGKIIVLEYISDGLFQREDGDIRIHKFAESAMHSYIYHQLVDKKRNVPEREKMRAERQWFNNRRIAKRRIKPIRYEELRQVLKGGTRWIKD